MRARTILGAAAVTAAAVFLAGCGGSSGAGSGSSLGAGAAVAPADSVAFVAVNTDTSSSQWQAVDALLQKFPGHDQLFTQLQQQLQQKTGLSWSDDVKPALGPELDLAVLPAASGGKPELVGLVQPGDSSKLTALLQKIDAKSGQTLVTAQTGGWTAIAGTQAALDAVTGASSHLADDNTYQDATSKLSGDSIASVYANGTEAQQLLGSLGKSLPTPATDVQLQWVSAGVAAESGGLKVDGYLRTQGGQSPGQPYASTLVSKIPSGALAVADFDASTHAASLPKGLSAALGGETALYVTAGAPIPAVTLVTHPSDPQAAADALDKAIGEFVTGLNNLPGGSVGLGSGGSGLSAILGSIHLYHDVVGDTLVASTSQQAISDYEGAGQKLADDGTFKDATSAASMPAETNGFVYVNLKEALPLVEGLVSMVGKGLPTGSQANLAALQTVTGYATAAGDEVHFAAFVQVG
ncbi:MAG TPA: DUF3352 domain-containing protein [Gaiellaceae bacterium]|nr:DUF3352 domain-containing protein [Gaiellaceae bacterium]